MSFVIDSIGKVGSIEIMNNNSLQIKKETERVFNLMPVWKPAINKGRPVNSSFQIAIK